VMTQDRVRETRGATQSKNTPWAPDGGLEHNAARSVRNQARAMDTLRKNASARIKFEPHEV
jgi:hypothetical protein